jgi:hypothetical protein
LDETHPVNPVHPVNVPGVNEIIGKFDGAERLRGALNQLRSLLYAYSSINHQRSTIGLLEHAQG